MKKSNETIFALSTPVGKSAIAVIRISGKAAFKVLEKIIHKKLAVSNTIKLRKIIHKGEILDQAMVVKFNKPKSYTGENMVEISTHGSPAVINKIIKTINTIDNIRIAEPGEFTRRAFENNKLDLTQVEAISDIVNAETEAQRKQALKQLSGIFSNKIKNWSNKIIKVLADIEAIIDFSDEDLPDSIVKKSKEQIENILNEIVSYIDDRGVGEKIRSGFIIGVIGKTNVGKSSFINMLAKREVSIVTEIPGTTRDSIELYVDYKGIPLKFYDTAGIRNTKNIIENIGVKKSYKISNLADVNLVFIRGASCINYFKNINNKIFVQSKTDILDKIILNKKIHYISSITRRGVKGLIESIYKEILGISMLDDSNVSRERHRKILNKTVKYLKMSLKPKNIDLMAEDLRLSFNEISKIYGKKDVEDILEIIFSDFCIGK